MKKSLLILSAVLIAAVFCVGLTACNGGNGDAVSIAIVSLPEKTEYLVGEAFDCTGLKIVTRDSVGTSSDQIQVTADMIDFDNSQLGETTVTITYKVSRKQSYYATFKVKIVPPRVTSISITTMPEVTDWVDGQTISLKGMVARVTYSDGTAADVNGEQFNFTPTQAKSSVAVNDKMLITVTKGSNSATAKFEINVKPRTVEGLQTYTAANKTTYVEGEEFSAEGLRLMLTYNDGSFELIDTDEVEFNSFIFALGDDHVTLSALGYTLDYPVTVEPKKIATIAVGANASYKTEYIEGDALNLSGLYFDVTYQNAEPSSILYDDTLNTVFVLSSAIAVKDATYVTLTYNYGEELSATVNVPITVSTLAVTSIVNVLDDPSAEYVLGENEFVDFKSVRLIAMYNKENKSEFIFGSDENNNLYMAEGVSCTLKADENNGQVAVTALGDYTFTVVYQGKSWSFTYHVR